MDKHGSSELHSEELERLGRQLLHEVDVYTITRKTRRDEELIEHKKWSSDRERIRATITKEEVASMVTRSSPSEPALPSNSSCQRRLTTKMQQVKSS
ncbi:hypothetical protein RJ639_021596 [Escallonia herrerae]|uniref:Uncharacterized protein n=1 Tax=Escallonia herrerae TaxID=1293975 RepID=A0AA88V8J6_9ASTE|nr:hypothetical protein RJ639_021596 [Escallonia herrerae]